MSRLILYHGTDLESGGDILKNGVDLSKGDPETDFGRGFYTTPDPYKAAKWAVRRAADNYSKPCLISMLVDEVYMMNIWKYFHKENMDWGQFIINNRAGVGYIKEVFGSLDKADHNIFQKYDIVAGKIADGRVTRIAHTLKRMTVKRRLSELELDDIVAKSYPFQYSFHTEEGLKGIKSYSEVKDIRRFL